MRRRMVEDDMVDCIISIGKNLFYNSPMEACIMLCSSKKPKERKGQVLFIRATDLVERKNGESYLTEEHIAEIVGLYRNNGNVENRSAIVNTKTITENEYSISPKLYVKNVGGETNLIDLDEVVEFWESGSKKLHEEMDKLSNLLM